jgi:hypothetical protein
MCNYYSTIGLGVRHVIKEPLLRIPVAFEMRNLSDRQGPFIH